MDNYLAALAMTTISGSLGLMAGVAAIQYRYVRKSLESKTPNQIRGEMENSDIPLVRPFTELLLRHYERDQ